MISLASWKHGIKRISHEHFNQMRLELFIFLSAFADETSGKRDNWCYLVKRTKEINEATSFTLVYISTSTILYSLYITIV